MRYNVTKLYIKRDWGSGKLTWRAAPEYIMKGKYKTALRKLNKKQAETAWFSGSSITPY